MLSDPLLEDNGRTRGDKLLRLSVDFERSLGSPCSFQKSGNQVTAVRSLHLADKEEEFSENIRFCPVDGRLLLRTSRRFSIMPDHTDGDGIDGKMRLSRFECV